MKIQIRKRYLVFPVNVLASKKKIAFLDDEKSVYELMVSIDNISPNFSAYVDVSRFIGKTLELTVEPAMEINYEEADEMNVEGLYNEPFRPQVHFTTRNGWINDPNGLIYLDGIYHMFYQHNPCAPEWGNMHWGHATSPDLIHWTEEEIALYPDATGMMYSGSGILDTENLSGLGTKDAPPALLYYTATEPFSQHLAYSKDGFKTITKYEGNPILPNIEKLNRDPKVVYCEEWNAYLMALYLEKDIYALFKSVDLLSWELVQRISLVGDNECPDIFHITASDGSRKWVFMGAHNRYLVGTMDRDGFTPDQETRTLHYGTSAYAGQTFSGMPDGRIVRMEWDRCLTTVGLGAFRSQMSIPTELTLHKSEDVYYLSALPIREIECLYNETQSYNSVTVDKSNTVKYKLSKAPYHIKLKIDDFKSAPQLTVKVFGRDLEINPGENEISFAKEIIPLSITQNNIDITLVIDRCSIEMFLDGGRIYASYLNNASISDYNVPYLELRSSENITIDHLELTSLKSIWNEKNQ